MNRLVALVDVHWLEMRLEDVQREAHFTETLLTKLRERIEAGDEYGMVEKLEWIGHSASTIRVKAARLEELADDDRDIFRTGARNDDA